MRSLPSSISQVLAGGEAIPAVQLLLQDVISRYSVFASGGTPGRCAALLSSAGTLIRATLTQNANPNSVVISRMPSAESAAGVAANWTAAGSVITANAMASAGVALAQTGSTIRCFYARATDNAICYRDSSNDGASFGPEGVVQSSYLGLTQTFGLMADGVNTVWAAQASYTAGPCFLCRSAYVSAWSAWSNEGPGQPAGWGRIRGMDLVTVAGSRKMLMGVETKAGVKGISPNAATWSGSTYSAFSTIKSMDNGDLGLSYPYNSLYYDNSAGIYYACLALADDGSVSGTVQTRVAVYTSNDFATWTPYLSLGTQFPYGCRCITLGGSLYLFDGQTVIAAGTGPAALNVSDDLLSLAITEADNRPGMIAFTLFNGNGQYNGHPCLTADSRVQVSLGYGGTTIVTHTAFIDAYSYAETADGGMVSIRCRDALRWLDHAGSRTLAYAGGTVGQLATQVSEQAGISLAALPSTPQFAQTVPCFVIQPGETWLQITNRLSQLYVLQFMASGTSLRIRDDGPSDAVTWSYGTETFALSYGCTADQANVIRVIGQGGSGPVVAEVVDSNALLSLGTERYLHIVDRMLDTAAKCRLRAQQTLQADARGNVFGSLRVSLNPAHELGDVIAVTDAAIGLSAAPVRIAGIRWTVDMNSGAFEQELQFTGV